MRLLLFIALLKLVEIKRREDLQDIMKTISRIFLFRLEYVILESTDEEYRRVIHIGKDSFGELLNFLKMDVFLIYLCNPIIQENQEELEIEIYC